MLPALIAVQPRTREPGLGSPVRWSYFYDRNAIVASQAVGDFLVAVTESGHVLLFSVPSVSLVGEALAPRGAVCVGSANGNEVAMGFADGVIARVSVPSLVATEITRVPGRPVWLGRGGSPDSDFVVYDDDPPSADSPWRPATHYTVRMLATGRETRIPDASAFLSDEEDRLWLGTDHGEWGGRVETLNLETGELQESVPGNVRGFTRVNGETWAYGGVCHLFCCHGFITRVAPGKPRALFRAESCPALGRPGRAQQPDFGIWSVVQVGNKVLVRSRSNFETDSRLRRWRRAADYELKRRFHRSFGTSRRYPTSWPPVVRGDRVLAPTGHDGYLELHAGSVVRHALSGELPIAPRTVVTDGRALAVGGYGARSIAYYVGEDWAQAEGRWLPTEPSDAELEGPARWCGLEVFPSPDGGLRVAAEWVPEGQECGLTGDRLRVTGRVANGTFREISRERTERRLEWMHLLPDGRLAARDDDNNLFAETAGGFREVPSVKWHSEIARDLGAYGNGWLVTTKGGPVGLCQLEVTAGAPRLTLLPLQIEGYQPELYDALRLGAETVLLATDRGLCTYDVPARHCTRISPRGLDHPVRRLARDGQGRMWAGGRGLFLLQSLERAQPAARIVPLLADADVVDISWSGNRLAVALDLRGLVLVDSDALSAALE